MSIVIIQKPKYKLIPAGQEHIIHSIYDAGVITAVSPKFKIRYIARVYVDTNMAMITATANKVATLKVSPNDVGHGIVFLNIRAYLILKRHRTLYT